MTAPIARFLLDSSQGERPCRAPRRALFLDRDGVINSDLGYVHRKQDTDWIGGIFELCLDARNAGLSLIVVTNQAGIARGYYSEAQFLEYTKWMHGEFAARGAPLLATFYCPHHPEAGLGSLRVVCSCRKPAPGMILAAVAKFDLEPTSSMLVGNSMSDVAAGRAAGIGLSVLIGGRNPVEESRGVVRVDNLGDVRSLLRMRYSSKECG